MYNFNFQESIYPLFDAIILLVYRQSILTFLLRFLSENLKELEFLIFPHFFVLNSY